MKNSLSSAIILLLASASSALASSGADQSGIGIMTILFLLFFGLLVATQVLPGLLLFITGAGGLFGKGSNHISSKH